MVINIKCNVSIKHLLHLHFVSEIQKRHLQHALKVLSIIYVARGPPVWALNQSSYREAWCSRRTLFTVYGRALHSKNFFFFSYPKSSYTPSLTISITNDSYEPVLFSKSKTYISSVWFNNRLLVLNETVLFINHSK